jgi:hypothetical protein
MFRLVFALALVASAAASCADLEGQDVYTAYHSCEHRLCPEGMEKCMAIEQTVTDGQGQ